MEYTEEQKADIQKQIEEATKGLLNQEQIDAIVSKRVKDLSDKHAKDLEEKEKIAKMTDATNGRLYREAIADDPSC